MAAGSAYDDSSRRIDEARRLIGLTLLLLLIAIVALGFAAILTIPRGLDREALAAVHSEADVARLAAIARIAADQSKANADRLALVLNIVFGPVATLVGSVTGYYFGVQARGKG